MCHCPLLTGPEPHRSRTKRWRHPPNYHHHNWISPPPAPEAWQCPNTQRLKCGTRSAMKSASGTGKKRDGQWPRRPDAGQEWAHWQDLGQRPIPRIPRALLSPQHNQEASVLSGALSLPPLPSCQGEEVFTWMGGDKADKWSREELKSP